MSAWRTVLGDVLQRKVQFALGVLAVLVASAAVVAAWTLLRAHDHRTAAILAAHEAKTHEELRRLEEAHAQTSAGTGFNLLIVPQASDPAKFLPEEYATRLASTRLMTIGQVLPTLQQKLQWARRKRPILLVGTRGEMPLRPSVEKPSLDPVPPGTVVLGHDLHTSLQLKVGSSFTMKGHEFIVRQCRAAHGEPDDNTAWINLKDAQELFDCAGKITALLAMNCHCPTERLGRVRAGVARLLPETRVVEYQTQAVTFAEERDRAAAAASAALEADRRERARRRSEREHLAALLVTPLVAVCGLGVGLLALVNGRARRGEIEAMRSAGAGAGQVVWVFVARAWFLGVVGGAAGYGAGLGVALGWAHRLGEGGNAVALFDGWLLAGVLVGAPLLVVLASWLPALAAARRCAFDPSPPPGSGLGKGSA